MKEKKKIKETRGLGIWSHMIEVGIFLMGVESGQFILNIEYYYLRHCKFACLHVKAT